MGDFADQPDDLASTERRLHQHADGRRVRQVIAVDEQHRHRLIDGDAHEKASHRARPRVQRSDTGIWLNGAKLK
jgi:hypothetical protein